MIRVGNAQAFWGDRNDAAAELIARCPELDYLTMDYLAEVSMSILASQRRKDPEAGYARDFLQVIHSLVPYWSSGGTCKLVTNAGGLDPVACGKAVKELLAKNGCGHLRVWVVDGDNCLDQLQNETRDCFAHLESGLSIREVSDRLVTANAYTGGRGIAEAVASGGDIVITGRVADPSMVVGICQANFGWDWSDYQRLAGATVAGHLIECGCHMTGGISTDWLSVPSNDRMAFPIVEIEEDGSCVATKPESAGGVVNEATVKEQLLYEIGDPNRYLSPDCRVDFGKLRLEHIGENRVRVSGAIGAPPTETLKVTGTFKDGYRAAGTLTIIGRDARRKALRCIEIVESQLTDRNIELRDFLCEVIGGKSFVGGSTPCDNRSGSIDATFLLSPNVADEPREVVLRLAAESECYDSLKEFTKMFVPLVTSGPQGTTGYAGGRPRISEVIRYWPCLIPANEVTLTASEIASPTVEQTGESSGDTNHWPPRFVQASDARVSSTQFDESKWQTCKDQMLGLRTYYGNTDGSVSLGAICTARSGDKGTGANIGIIARESRYFDWLTHWMTAEHVDDYFKAYLPACNNAATELDGRRAGVMRYLLPNLHAMNFVLPGVLSRGLQNDAQGKALGMLLLEMKLPADCPFLSD